MKNNRKGAKLAVFMAVFVCLLMTTGAFLGAAQQSSTGIVGSKSTQVESNDSPGEIDSGPALENVEAVTEDNLDQETKNRLADKILGDDTGNTNDEIQLIDSNNNIKN